ncbi:MAG: hypothetical protein Q9213_001573 [Squamulea squamosa]
MALTSALLLALTTLFNLASPRALAPVSPEPEGSLQQPSTLPISVWDPATPGNLVPVKNSTLQAAFESSDPLAVLRNTTQEPLTKQVFQCNGTTYGYHLPLQSCVGALMLIPNVVRDGLCAVDFERNSDALSDVARGSDLVKAGQVLLTECSLQGQQGGIIRNLGVLPSTSSLYEILFQECSLNKKGDKGRINLIIRTYSPNVRCSSSPATSPSYGTCLNIVGKQLPADKDTRAFGRVGTPLVRAPEWLSKTITDSRSFL